MIRKTDKIDISPREQRIIGILLERGALPSSGIHEALAERGDSISLVTVKRALSGMAVRKIIITIGSGRALSYKVGIPGRLFADIDARAYCAIEPDRRYGQTRYHHELFAEIPRSLFPRKNRKSLKQRPWNIRAARLTCRPP